MIRLGINIDHVATLRNARGENHPNIVYSAKKVMDSGASLITIHLREDRRHIKEFDLRELTKRKIPINLEMAANKEMLKIALKYMPNYICIVPEKRNEITTEGGLDLKKNFINLRKIVNKLNDKKIRTSLFIDPSLKNIKLSKLIKSKCVEIHTGKISRLVKNNKNYKNELKKIRDCVNYATTLGIEVHAGHGLDYKTAKIMSNIKNIKEFNIGHFIIGEAIFFGVDKVIKRFKRICK